MFLNRRELTTPLPELEIFFLIPKPIGTPIIEFSPSKALKMTLKQILNLTGTIYDGKNLGQNKNIFLDRDSNLIFFSMGT